MWIQVSELKKPTSQAEITKNYNNYEIAEGMAEVLWSMSEQHIRKTSILFIRGNLLGL